MREGLPFLHRFSVTRARLPITESFTIRYRRPEAPWSVVKMTVPNADAAKAQIDRLRALGYSIIDAEQATPAALDETRDRIAYRGRVPPIGRA